MSSPSASFYDAETDVEDGVLSYVQSFSKIQKSIHGGPDKRETRGKRDNNKPDFTAKNTHDAQER